MQVVTLKKSKSPQLAVTAEPRIVSDQDVKIQVKASGICGSDLQKFNSEIPPSQYLPIDILGHEIAGEVIEIGKNVDGIPVGSRVTVNPLIPCYACQLCQQGIYQQCPSLNAVGRTLQGGFAEYVVVPSSNTRLVAKTMSFIEAALLDVVAVVVHAYHVAKLPKKKRILIIGDGSVALLLLQILKYHKNSIDLLGKNASNMEIARKIGVSAYGTGDHKLVNDIYDIVFETVGKRQSETLNQSIRYVKPRGTIIVLGVTELGYLPELKFRDLLYKEAKMFGSNSYGIWKGKNEFDMALEMVNKNIVKPLLIVSHIKPMSQFHHALKMLEYKKKSNAIKIVLDPQN